MSKQNGFTLRQVVELTGLSEFTLRGWENRYQAFLPDRNSTGRRHYTAAELQKALRLRELVKRGHHIGKIAQLPVNRLDELMLVHEVPEDDKILESRRADGSKKIAEALRMTAVQEWEELDRFLRKECTRPDSVTVLRNLIVPLLQTLSMKVASGEISIAQEHIFSSLLKKRLHALSDQPPKRTSRIKFAFATPEGDWHELGILTAHALVCAHRLPSLFIGANTPKNEVCETVLRFGASHLVIGATVSRREGAKEDLLSYIHFLDRHLPRSVNLWMGGRQCAGTAPELARESAHFASLLEFDDRLSALDR